MIDWENPSISTVHADGSFSKKGDFAIKISAMVEAQDNTGFIAVVKRAIDNKKR